MTMKTSPAGIALIKRFEGLEIEAYQDIAGIWTIGYGHTGADVKPGLVWTEQVAEAALTLELELWEDVVNRNVKVILNQNEFDALVSFVHNVGAGAFKGSTALKRLNNGDRAGAAEALTWWDKAKVNGVLRPVQGLTNRRIGERDLFLRPMDPPPIVAMSDNEGCVNAPGRCADASITAPTSDRPQQKGLFSWLP